MEQMHSWLPPSTTRLFSILFSTPSLSPYFVNCPEQDINQEQQFHICHQKVAFSLRTAAAEPSCNKQIMRCHLVLTHRQCKTSFISSIFFLLHKNCVTGDTNKRLSRWFCVRFWTNCNDISNSINPRPMIRNSFKPFVADIFISL